jgi:hypothetical protein
MEYENICQKVLLAVDWTTYQRVIYGIPNCKEARENVSCIRSTTSCEVFDLPAPFRCRTLLVSWNCFMQRRIALSDGGYFLYFFLRNNVAFWWQSFSQKAKVSTFLSLEQSPFWGMTLYFLPDINVASITCPKENFLSYIFAFLKQFSLFLPV